MGYTWFFSLSRHPRPTLLVLIAISVALWMGAVARACPRVVIDEGELLPGLPPVFRSGDSLIKEGVFAIALQPAADVYLPRPLDGEPAGYGGFVTFEGLPEARYALGLSQNVRAQLLRHPDLRLIPLIELMHSSCGLVAEFFVPGGPLPFQVMGASASIIGVVVWRRPD